ncbi:hypothetical protein N7466_001689 [Penicillium verhagenii]|uniref:uncharacterized protein n=1 Tax=Penicillium verhagenii TaxID=1562060 RepID=UPI002545A04D|nr:uncharacterized protein N7466_001689 [Penicillium verhagenii]KAJ5938555.1 hypothetical protein N7466_001689 [Penicillium verhagenii]
MPSPKSILAAISFAPWVSASAIPRADRFHWSSKKALLAFGDSYTYVQGTHGLQNYSFIGDAFDFSYDQETLLSNKIVQNQTGTAEGGPNWVEYLTVSDRVNRQELPEEITSPRCPIRMFLIVLCLTSTYLLHSTPLHHNYTVPFVDQIKQYATYGHSTLSKFLTTSETLVAVWIGINDVGDSAKYAVDFPTFYANLTNTLFNSVDTLYDLGYRSYLIMNLPPMDRDPDNVGSSYSTPNVTQVAWYNAALTERAGKFGEEKKDVEIQVFDAHARLSWILDHPSEFGIVNTTDYCAGYDQPDIAWNYKAYGCPTPLDEYFWYNTGHMTSHTHRLLASELEKWLQS